MIDENGKKIICSSCGKVCYTEEECGYFLNMVKCRYKCRSMKKASHIPKRKYFCQQCGYWHLTHITAYKKNKY